MVVTAAAITFLQSPPAFKKLYKREEKKKKNLRKFSDAYPPARRLVTKGHILRAARSKTVRP